MKYGCQSMVGKIESILIKRPQQAFISQENLDNTWEDFKYFGCPDYDKVLKEYQVFENYITENVENVYYLPQDYRAGLDSIYTHDPLKITKKERSIFLWEKNCGVKSIRQQKSFLKRKEFQH